MVFQWWSIVDFVLKIHLVSPQNRVVALQINIDQTLGQQSALIMKIRVLMSAQVIQEININL